MPDSKIKNGAKEPGFNPLLDLATKFGSSSASVELLRIAHGDKIEGEDIYHSFVRLGNTEAINAIEEGRRKAGDLIPTSVRKGRDDILRCAYLLAASEPIISGKNNGNPVVNAILNLRRDAGMKQIGGAASTGTRA